MMSIASKIRGVSSKACVSIAKMFHAAGREGLFRVGAVSCCGWGYRSRFTTVRVSAGGERVVGVLLEEGFYSREYPWSYVVDKRS